MSSELTTYRRNPAQPDIRPSSSVPPPRAPRDAGDQVDLQVDVLSVAPLVVTVSGEIDIATVVRLLEELLGAMRRHGARLALDLSGVTFMDWAGVNALLAIRRRAQFEGGWVRVPQASRSAWKALVLTGLDQEFALTDLEPAAAA
jgi:anti-sigma B factor antagonist